jgi:heme ABC exporter ATP-binding subunit CcmA
MTADPIIRATGLRKVLGTTLVLEGVSFEVAAGENVALLGANGAGKTTLLRILATLLRPSRGTASIAGFDCVREAARVREQVGLAAHGTMVYDDLTAIENLRFWSGVAGRRVTLPELTETLAGVDLDGYANERVRGFSAGMKRRLALARIILARPRVLLLDEPFASLDQRGRKWLEEYLRAFKTDGGGILMVSHNFAHVLTVADRIAILSGGRIALDRPRAALTADELARLYAFHTEAEGW